MIALMNSIPSRFKGASEYFSEKLTSLKKGLVERNQGYHFVIWISLVVVSLLSYSVYPVFSLNENQILYLFSAASQVMAAIYGLTITGYIFLRNELDRKADKDETFEEIVSLMKTEYFGFIIDISLVTLSSILFCILVMTVESDDHSVLIDLLINISVPTIITNLFLIVDFVAKILNPNSLEIASNRLREISSQDQSDDKGSLEEFLKNYNYLEQILEKYGMTFLEGGPSWPDDVSRRRIAKTKLVNILFRERKIDFELRNKLIELISFRNSIIHGSELYVSRSDVERSEQILNELKEILNIH